MWIAEMKKALALIALFTCLATGCNLSGYGGDLATETAFNEAFEKGDVFLLEERMPVWNEKLPDYSKVMGRFYLDYFFNRPSESNENINTFFKDFSDVSDSEFDHSLLQIRYNNHLKLGEYQKAAQNLGIILEDFPGAMGEENDNNLRNMEKICWILEQTPPPAASFASPTELAFARGNYGYSTLVVPMDGDTVSWVLDFESDFSIIQRSLAEQMGWDIPKENIKVQNVYGNVVPASIVVLDTFRLGAIEWFHLPFIVMDDENLIVEDEYEIKGILGGSALALLERITISKNGKFTVSKGGGENSGAATMGMDKWSCFALATYQEDTLKFAIAVDYSEPYLFPRFYEKYGDAMDAARDGSDFSEVGSSVEAYGFDMDLKIGGKNLHLENLNLETSNQWADAMGVHGVLGIGQFEQYDSFTLDYTLPAFFLK